MADDAKDRRRDAKAKRDTYDGPLPHDIKPERIGPAMTAFYALHGELAGDPAPAVAWAAETISDQLLAHGPGVANPITDRQQATAIHDAHLLLRLVAELFGGLDIPADDEAALAFRAELKRARGRPETSGKFAARSIRWRSVAAEVEALIAEGDLQKAAVNKVAERLGLKDADVAGWCRKLRKIREQESRRARNSDNSAI